VVLPVQQAWPFKHGPDPVGAFEGLLDGPFVGLFVGTCVGLVVGGNVGRIVTVGLPVVGPDVGVAVGDDSAALPTMASIEPSEVLLES